MRDATWRELGRKVCADEQLGAKGRPRAGAEAYRRIKESARRYEERC